MAMDGTIIRHRLMAIFHVNLVCQFATFPVSSYTHMTGQYSLYPHTTSDFTLLTHINCHTKGFEEGWMCFLSPNQQYQNTDNTNGQKHK